MADHYRESENRFRSEKGFTPHKKGENMRYAQHSKELDLHKNIFKTGDHASMLALHRKNRTADN